MPDSPRVLLVSLDAFNHHAVSPELTPHLWRLGAEGGIAREGGVGDLPSSTYVSHASLLTGASPARHGLTSNRAANPLPGTVPGWAGDERVRMLGLFDAARAAGVPAAAIAGDWHILRVAGVDDAAPAFRWPGPAGPPAGTALDAFGYAANAAVLDAALAAAADPAIRLLFVHFNETDTVGHLNGPGHPDTQAAYGETDRCVGRLLDAMRPGWSDTVAIVVSDHGMEAMTAEAAIDLDAEPSLAGLLAGSVDEGGAALALVREGVAAEDAGAALLRIPGIASWRETSPGVLLLEAEPGNVFARGETKHVAGIHGGPGTARTVAIVGGGHPAVERIAASLASRRPAISDWAPTVAAVLGLDLPDADGVNLAG